MRNTNVKVRIAAAQYGFAQYEVAKIIGFSEYHFSRKMRNELPESEQDKIVNQIKAAYEEKIQELNQHESDIEILKELLVSDRIYEKEKAALRRILNV